MKLKPMEWNQPNTLLQTATVMGIMYSVQDTSLQVTCRVEGVTIYQGDSVDDAKEGAYLDALRRWLDLAE